MTSPLAVVFSPDVVVSTPARNMLKLQGVADAVLARGLGRLVPPTRVPRALLERLHAPAYVEAFLNGVEPLCRSNNLPWSPALVQAVLLMNGGMLTATTIAENEGVAINLAQGFHHAGYAQGEAYCTFNGLALVAAAHPHKRVFVLDMDQHGGNGTEALTARLDNLEAFTIHGSPFGCVGGPRSHVRCLRGLTDNPEPMFDALDEALAMASGADLLLYQAGVDCHVDDPHGSMGLTDAHLRERDRRVFAWARAQGIPVVATLAGGYQRLERVVALHVATVEAMQQVFERPRAVDPPPAPLPQEL